MTEATDVDSPPQEELHVFGSGSVAHQIIGQFLAKLHQTEGYEGISDKLGAVVFDEKVTELKLRRALFGEEPL